MTQNLFLCTLGGAAGTAVERLWSQWGRLAPGSVQVDRLCEALRAHADDACLLYACSWIDRWSMGDTIHGSHQYEGSRFEVSGMTRSEARVKAREMSDQFPEYETMSARYIEAASAWEENAPSAFIVMIREVLDVSTLNEEMEQAAARTPDWLLPFTSEPG